MRTSVPVPLVQTAGTTAKNLEIQAREVRNTARELLDALNRAAPKECDYYGHPRPSEWERALQEHLERCRMVNKVRNDFDAILSEIEDQSQRQSGGTKQVRGATASQGPTQSYGRR